MLCSVKGIETIIALFFFSVYSSTIFARENHVPNQSSAALDSNRVSVSEKSLRDPEIEARIPKSEKSARALLLEIQEMLVDIDIADSARRLEIIEDLYKANITFAYYISDVGPKEASRIFRDNPDYSSIDKVRKNIAKYTAKYAKYMSAAAGNQNSVKKQSSALYHMITARYFLQSDKNESIKEMKNLVATLEPPLRDKALLLIKAHDKGFELAKSEVKADMIPASFSQKDNSGSK
ncbi:MAG: hypothetical protein HQK54_13825 [Oligoflexales bacterium]|nr:hypothetical protein [Oligoflexales bacterium]